MPPSFGPPPPPLPPPPLWGRRGRASAPGAGGGGGGGERKLWWRLCESGERPEGEGASLSPVRTPQEREREEEEEEGVYCLAPKRREALRDGTLLPLPLLVVAKRENPLPPPPFLCAKKRVPELGLLSLRLLRWRPPLHSAAEVASPSTHTRSLGRDTSLRGAGSLLSSLLSLRGAWPDRPPLPPPLFFLGVVLFPLSLSERAAASFSPPRPPLAPRLAACAKKRGGRKERRPNLHFPPPFPS